MIRRLAALTLTAVVLAGPLVAPAAAESTVPSGTWKDSKVNPIAPVTSAQVPYAGVVINSTYSFGLRAKPSVRASIAPEACTAPTASSAVVGNEEAVGGRGRYDYSGTVTTPNRNGTYSLHVCFAGLQVDTPFDVRLPAPTVTNVVASAAGRTVTVTWDDMAPAAPDVSGYVVQRRLGTEGEFVALATVEPTAFSYADTALPTAGGDATYRVVATRPGVAESAPSVESSATFPAGPVAPPPGGGDGGTDAGDGGGGDGGGPGGPTDGGTAPDPGGGSTIIGRRGSRPANGIVIRAPRVGLPSNAFFPPLLTPPRVGEVDTGFEDELPYEAEPGDEDPVLPDDELASTPLDDDDAASKGLVIPVATALVLAVWAFHLRYLARASKPRYLDDHLELD